MVKNRITQEPAYILHHYDWSESSLILEVFTARFGRIALVAKGVKRPTSSYRAVLLPLQKLAIDFSGDGEIKILKNAKWQGDSVMPIGERLLMGYYFNELLMTLIARDDPHPTVYALYTRIVHLLCYISPPELQSITRAYELSLLRCLGLLPKLDIDSIAQKNVESADHYALSESLGIHKVKITTYTASYPILGIHWQALEHGLSQYEKTGDLLSLLHACQSTGQALRIQLKNFIAENTHRKTLQTSLLVQDLITLRS